ncbi:MAG: DUF799 family lipoprotein, partial [Elusimicrobiales bacterium]|nr:DUF799 family lipoprotein [Elusimicrobiales bacterium]
MKKYIFFLLLFFIAGCGNYRYVKISYPSAQPAAEARRALSSLYVIVKANSSNKIKITNNLLKSLAGGSHFDINGLLLAKGVSKDFNDRGAKVAAFRFLGAKSMEFDLARLIKPRGILEINLSKPSVSISEIEREIEYYDKKTKKTKKGKSKVWIYKARLKARSKLISFPALAVLDEWIVQINYEEEKNSKDMNKEFWFESVQEKMFKKVQRKFSSRYFGIPVLKGRPVFFVKKDAESEKAYVFSQKRNWKKAEKIWLKRIAERSDWRDLMNMGVSKELKKEYSKALEYYRLAREKSSGDKEAKNIRWAGIFRDIEFATSGPIELEANSFKWFDYKIAILPFASEVVSMDGPVMLRKMIYEGLRESGYDILSIKKTDALLRENGFSDGGQLRRVDEKKICEGLNVDAIVSVNVTDFNDI